MLPPVIIRPLSSVEKVWEVLCTERGLQSTESGWCWLTELLTQQCELGFPAFCLFLVICSDSRSPPIMLKGYKQFTWTLGGIGWVSLRRQPSGTVCGPSHLMGCESPSVLQTGWKVSKSQNLIVLWQWKAGRWCNFTQPQSKDNPRFVCNIFTQSIILDLVHTWTLL